MIWNKKGTVPIGNTEMNYAAYEEADDFNKRVFDFLGR